MKTEQRTTHAQFEFSQCQSQRRRPSECAKVKNSDYSFFLVLGRRSVGLGWSVSQSGRQSVRSGWKAAPVITEGSSSRTGSLPVQR